LKTIPQSSCEKSRTSLSVSKRELNYYYYLDVKSKWLILLLIEQDIWCYLVNVL